MLDHVQYNGSVPWQGEEQSVPCKFSDSNPASCVCHLVKRNQTQFHYPLGPWMYLQYPWAQPLEGMSGCFRPSLCQSAFFGPACVCSLLKMLMKASACYIIERLLISALSFSSIQSLKVSSQMTVITLIQTFFSRSHKPGVTLCFWASLSNLQPYKLYSFLWSESFRCSFIPGDTFGDREGNHHDWFILAILYLKMCLFSDHGLSIL